jgi:hypothetical protein
MSSEPLTCSGSVMMPSRIASTCPRIAVRGVRSSWDTDIRNERLSFSASAFAAMLRKLGESDTSSPASSRDLDVVSTGYILHRAQSERARSTVENQ